MISSSSILGGGCGKRCEPMSLAGSETKTQAEMFGFFTDVSEVGDSGWHKFVLAPAGRIPLSLVLICLCSH